MPFKQGTPVPPKDSLALQHLRELVFRKLPTKHSLYCGKRLISQNVVDRSTGSNFS